MTVAFAPKTDARSNKDRAAAIVLKLAHQHNIHYVKTARDRWADKVTELAGDEVQFDEIEQLIIALERAKVVSSDDATNLIKAYLGGR